VREQFEYVEIGDGPCGASSAADEPHIASERPIEFVLTEALICLPGFDPESPTDVEMVAPDGETTRLTAPTPAEGYDPATVYDGIPYLLYDLDLYALTGVYEITATQGSTVASGMLEVEQPPVGILRIRPPTNGSPGDEFTIDLAGLPAGSPVSLDIYTPLDDEPAFTYVTSIATAATDDLGRVQHVFATSPSDPPGVYCFIIRGSESPGCPTGEVIKLD
jgi:hypothetical protein